MPQNDVHTNSINIMIRNVLEHFRPFCTGSNDKYIKLFQNEIKPLVNNSRCSEVNAQIKQMEEHPKDAWTQLPFINEAGEQEYDNSYTLCEILNIVCMLTLIHPPKNNKQDRVITLFNELLRLKRNPVCSAGQINNIFFAIGGCFNGSELIFLNENEFFANQVFAGKAVLDKEGPDYYLYFQIKIEENTFKKVRIVDSALIALLNDNSTDKYAIEQKTDKILRENNAYNPLSGFKIFEDVNGALLAEAQTYLYRQLEQLPPAEKFRVQIGWIFQEEHTITKLQEYSHTLSQHLKDFLASCGLGNHSKSIEFVEYIAQNIDEIEMPDSEHPTIVPVIKEVTNNITYGPRYNSLLPRLKSWLNKHGSFETIQTNKDKLEYFKKLYTYYSHAEQEQKQTVSVLMHNIIEPYRKYKNKLLESIDNFFSVAERSSLNIESIDDLTAQYETQIYDLKKSANYHFIRDFFTTYYTTNDINLKQQLMDLAKSHRQYICLRDEEIDLISTAIDNEENTISPYEINRIFLHALTTNTADWSQKFTSLVNNIRMGPGLSYVNKVDFEPNEILNILTALHKIKDGISNQSPFALFKSASTNVHPISQIPLKAYINSIIGASNSSRRSIQVNTLIESLSEKVPDGLDKGKTGAYLLASTLNSYAARNNLEYINDISALFLRIASTHPEKLIDALTVCAEKGPDKNTNGALHIVFSLKHNLVRTLKPFSNITKMLHILAATHPNKLIESLTATLNIGPYDGMNGAWFLNKVLCDTLKDNPNHAEGIINILLTLAQLQPEKLITALNCKNAALDLTGSFYYAVSSNYTGTVKIIELMQLLVTSNPTKFLDTIIPSAENQMSGINGVLILTSAFINSAPINGENSLVVKELLLRLTEDNNTKFIKALAMFSTSYQSHRETNGAFMLTEALYQAFRRNNNEAIQSITELLQKITNNHENNFIEALNIQLTKDETRDCSVSRNIYSTVFRQISNIPTYPESIKRVFASFAGNKNPLKPISPNIFFKPEDEEKQKKAHHNPGPNNQ